MAAKQHSLNEDIKNLLKCCLYRHMNKPAALIQLIPDTINPIQPCAVWFDIATRLREMLAVGCCSNVQHMLFASLADSQLFVLQQVTNSYRLWSACQSAIDYGAVYKWLRRCHNILWLILDYICQIPCFVQESCMDQQHLTAGGKDSTIITCALVILNGSSVE